jgi:hypothetical protein
MARLPDETAISGPSIGSSGRPIATSTPPAMRAAPRRRALPKGEGTKALGRA